MISNKNNKNRKNILFTVQFAILLALEAIFCFTPLGSIPFTPVMVATTAMLPVIITSLLLGTKAGTLMGFFAGIFSLIVWTFTPPPTSAMFAFLYTPFYSFGEIQGNGFSLVISIVPRVFVGLFSGLLFGALKGIMSKSKKTETVLYAVCGIVGSLANTVFVLGFSYVFFLKDIAVVSGISAGDVFKIIIISIVISNGIPELIVSAIVAVFVCMPLRYILKKQNLL